MGCVFYAYCFSSFAIVWLFCCFCFLLVVVFGGVCLWLGFFWVSQ